MNKTDTKLLPSAPIPRPETQQDVNVGLTSQEAQIRLAGGWGNAVIGKYTRTVGQIIAQNLLTFFNLIFVILALLLVISGSHIKNLSFLVVVIINIIIGCFQEIRAKLAVDKLTLVAAQNLKTIRDGKVVSVRSDLLVLGDIVEFHAGDQICADGIVHTGELQVNESLITGEADAVIKKPGDELRSGSFVIAGTGRAQLTNVGNRSYAARLAAEAKADPRVAQSEMMSQLTKLLRVIAVLLVPIGFILFFHEFKALDLGLLESAESTVSALVGMIPEGLYLLTSIALAASSLKLSQEKVLVQDMNCIETLARVDVLCVDKTGTITEPVMEVSNVIPLSTDPPEYLDQLLCSIYGGSEPENDTARALNEMFNARTDWVRVRQIPFTSQTKWSATIFRDHGAFLVGAPEFIMGERYCELRQVADGWSAKGYRVLLVAAYAGTPQPGALDADRVSPMALILLTNRIREDAHTTFAYFAAQGVTIKVISGDNPITVSEVAGKAGIRDADKYIDAGVLETDEDFLQAVDTYAVFGRVTPDKKKKLILALKSKGHTVAMTGDGVNDVLAMKESDCGIAMASGAQAASQVARLVLLKSDFAAMPSIVGEGRRVINNIQRAAALFLVKNIFSLGLSMLAVITGQDYPMLPLHMSIISGLTIGVPSFFLAMEPNYERVTGAFLPSVLRRAFPGGLTNVIVSLTALGFANAFQLTPTQTSTICTAVLSAVGLLVLYQICTPFNTFRKVIWGLTAGLLLSCFLFLGGILELQFGNTTALLVLLALLVMCPTIFFVLNRIFAFGDRLLAKYKAKKGK